MRRNKPVMIRVRAPSRGLITRWPSESADLFGTGAQASGLLGPSSRAATVSSNTRYEDGVVCNAPGYDRVGLDIPLLDGIVAHWRMEEFSGTRFDATLNHRDLSEQAGTGIDDPTVQQDSGKFGNSALFTSVVHFVPPSLTFFLVDDNVVTGPSGDCFGGFVIGSTAYISNGGDFWSSTDGTNWTDLSTVSISPNSLASDGSLIVAAGSFFGGGQMALSSDTGLTWTTHSIGSSSAMQVIIFANGLFVTGGQNGDIASSANGVTWTLSNIGGGSFAILSLAYGAGVYVAGGEGGILYTSPDGATWTAQSSGLGGSITGITYSGSQFLAVSGTSIITSPDGVTWTAGPSAPASFLSVAFFDSMYLAGVGSGATTPVVYTSPDGITWTAQAPVATASRIMTQFIRLAANTYIVTEGTHS